MWGDRATAPAAAAAAAAAAAITADVSSDLIFSTLSSTSAISRSSWRLSSAMLPASSAFLSFPLPRLPAMSTTVLAVVVPAADTDRERPWLPGPPPPPLLPPPSIVFDAYPDLPELPDLPAADVALSDDPVTAVGSESADVEPSGEAAILPSDMWRVWRGGVHPGVVTAPLVLVRRCSGEPRWYICPPALRSSADESADRILDSSSSHWS